MKIRTLMAASAITLLTAGTAFAASVVNLGFAVDRSGSVGGTNFATTTSGLANALEKIPTTGSVQYRISVVAFATSATTEITPVIVTNANKAALKAQVAAIPYSGGGTDIAESIDLLASNFAAYSSELALLNIATDGQSNDSLLRAAAANALTSGIDGISYEGIGGGVDTGALSSACYGNASYVNPFADGPANGCVVTNDETALPDATQVGFVLTVAGFSSFENAITSKIASVVIDTGGGDDTTTIPLPAAGWMLLAGLGGLFVRRRRAAA